MFPFTSISKPFTAVQVLTLVDDGRLDLHAPVCEYIPEFGVAHKGAVTTAQMLSHTSGVDPSANLIEGPQTLLTTEGYLQAALEVGLVTPAGKVFAYCSPTFWVLGELVTRLTGLPYPEHMQERVLKPMGADHANYRLGQVEDRLVLPRTPPGLEHLPDQTTLVPYPAGGLIGRASDLLALGRCMFAEGLGARGRVITSAAARLMRRPTASGMIAGRAVGGDSAGSWAARAASGMTRRSIMAGRQASRCGLIWTRRSAPPCSHVHGERPERCSRRRSTGSSGRSAARPRLARINGPN